MLNKCVNPPNDLKALLINRSLFIAVVCISLTIRCVASETNEFILVESNDQFQSVLQNDITHPTIVKSFWMQRHPVTNDEYLKFVMSHPQWRRGTIALMFAHDEYLDHWQSSVSLGLTVSGNQPVTRISWFAAQAYCESINARLPTWNEWEWVGAANETTKDARNDGKWRQQILDWYAKPGSDPNQVMQAHANVYGIYDMHGLVWEWVLDFSSLMDGNEAQKFCGSGALNLQQKENFVVLMRVATLSSLHATDTMHTLGFRCARDNSSNVLQ